MSVIEFPQIIERGYGLDIYRDTFVATIQGKYIEKETKTFKCFTTDLEYSFVGYKIME